MPPQYRLAAVQFGRRRCMGCAMHGPLDRIVRTAVNAPVPLREVGNMESSVPRALIFLLAPPSAHAAEDIRVGHMEVAAEYVNRFDVMTPIRFRSGRFRSLQRCPFFPSRHSALVRGLYGRRVLLAGPVQPFACGALRLRPARGVLRAGGLWEHYSLAGFLWRLAPDIRRAQLAAKENAR